jgi:ABC-2 type transport system ATP-binding protein
MSIEVKNISKYYGKQKALDEVTFNINSGELTGFLGPNGAGKSTLMKIITGYLKPTSGCVLISGEVITDISLNIKRKIGYLPENNPLYPEMYVKEYLTFIAGIYKIGKSEIDNIIEITGLKPEYKKRIGLLSKGYKQRVGIAQALIHNPEVLILDEPTSGLDPNQVIEIRELIKNVSEHKTVLLSTHIMQEVEAICKRVIIIDKGKIIADDLAENIKKYQADNINTILVEFNVEIDLDKIRNINGIKEIIKLKSQTYLFTCSKDMDIRPEIFSFAVKNNILVLEMQLKEKSLEEVFKELTVKN